MKLNKRHTQLIRHISLHAIVIALLCVWFMAINRTAQLKLSGISIELDKVEGVKDLVTSKELNHLITKELPNDILNQSITDIDLEEIEKMLNSDSRIFNAEVFIDAKTQLVVDIVQRRPVMRVMNQNGDQYYVDQAGDFVRKGNYRAIRVPVVTGYIENYSSDSNLDKAPKLKQAYTIATALKKDEVLSALIEQIHFEKNSRVILIPKIGKEKIVLDHQEELNDKLKQLKVFYKELARTNGWGKFDTIDISYKNVVYGRNSEQP